MNYTPDKWAVVKIGGQDPHYRIFGSWRGGYTSGDSWRLNSGVKSYTEDEDYYYFHGFSNSTYVCHKKGYGVAGMYCIGVIEDLCSDENTSYFKEMPVIEELDFEVK